MQLSPLGFAACQSKNCTNQANNTPKRGMQLSQLHQPSNHYTFSTMKWIVITSPDFVSGEALS